jgi:hypothetical protein
MAQRFGNSRVALRVSHPNRDPRYQLALLSAIYETEAVNLNISQRTSNGSSAMAVRDRRHREDRRAVSLRRDFDSSQFRIERPQEKADRMTVDVHWLVTRTGTEGPGLRQKNLGDSVELTDVTERKTMQKRADRRGRHHPM